MTRVRTLAVVTLTACRLDTTGLAAPSRDTGVIVRDSEVVDTHVVEDEGKPPEPPRVVPDAGTDSREAGVEYFGLEEPLDWYDARDECIKRGAHLATITVAAELDLLKTIGTGDRWLGLRKDADAGVFNWITGEPFSLDGWKPGEPNGTGSCGKIVETGEWWDHSCLDKLIAICERE